MACPIPKSVDSPRSVLFRNWEATQFLALRTLLTLAVGGATGALLDYFRSALAAQTLDLTRVDWHAVAMNAAGGALLAVLYHFQASPLVQARARAAADSADNRP